MSHVLLQARSLRLARAGRPLLDDVSLDIVAGRTLAVLGANGAGKSLLLRVLHALVAPDEGRILCDGRPLDRAARDRQAMVFQRPVLLRRSVGANLVFALAARGVRGTERRRRVGEGLALAQLSDQARQPARELSGGEQQRLATARALIARPELLFLDEPTASLDPASTAAIEALIGQARGRGTACVLVTHSAAQARRLADDIVFLDAGRIVERGDARALDAPTTTALADWLAGRLPARPSEPTPHASMTATPTEILVP